ncbi:hypothetical protein F511_38932 [Dorcoceras hygrometricum]|uniref:Transcription factor GTE4-like n=1 Tax=Dorcoceras hygrometricum TaxID=472368 RepID=A0A2Z7DDP9_9LAMI|nr:hypothetical protein F511_38932 [Dorcoceras hygrometricum]
MDSGTTGDSGNDNLKLRSTVSWTENRKVYTRRARKKVPETKVDIDTSNIGTGTSTGASTSTGNPSTTAASTEEHIGSVVAATSKPTNGIPSTSATSTRYLVKNVLQECVEASVTEDIDSSLERLQVQSPTLEQTLSQTLAERDVDSFQSQQLLGRVKHDEQRPSVSENDCTRQNVGGQGSCCQSLGQQNQRRLSPLLNDAESQSPKETTSFHSEKEKMRTNENVRQNLREPSLLSSENDLPNDNLIKLQNDENSMSVPPPAPSSNGPAHTSDLVQPLVITRIDNRIRKLADELEVKERELASSNAQVSNSNFNNIGSGVEGSEIGGFYLPQPVNVPNEAVERRALVRINSEVSVMGIKETPPMKLARLSSDVGIARTLEPKSYGRQLSIAVMENTHDAGEIIDKEKRTPKANQYYRNSEFLLGKDRLPPESNKKLKANHRRKHGGRSEQARGFGFGFDKNRNQVFKSCSSILQRLMNHKHGWVFNEPVDAEALELHDYHVIIKHPMDLGTIKTRLSQNWYKSPREFAEDVRLVFRNAMTYNPKGQDVHVMAEELSGIFEEKWAVMETKFNPYLKYHVYQDAGLPTPTSRKFPQPYSAPVSAPASVHAFAPTAPLTIDSKNQRAHVGRMPLPKKPKAKDMNKRDMTYEEKQRLSNNLQNLASDKLDAIIQIIKKNSTALSQHDDEIEVDIDSVDPETLWELDRFVSNYKKGLSKNKRKAELALQARTVSNRSVSLTTTTPTVQEVQVESGTVIDKQDTHAVEGGKQGNDVSRSSSSGSSSSDSGASSTDSDSGHTSGDESDAG